MYLEIYCDGACIGNGLRQNRGGWAAILRNGEKMSRISGSEMNTTNQRMEILGCIRGLEKAHAFQDKVYVYSDSAYLVNCMNDKWYANWQRNGWLNTKKQPVENRDLWEKLLELTGKMDVSFHKVHGHSGNGLNEQADELARKAALKAQP